MKVSTRSANFLMQQEMASILMQRQRDRLVAYLKKNKIKHTWIDDECVIEIQVKPKRTRR